jgi:type II secretory pathway predicted ATPase ExeA
MYEQFFNFMGLREDPFHVSPDPRFYYTTPAHEAALARLMFGIENRQGFLVLTGEAGTGKTSLLNRILDWLHRRKRSTAFIFHAHLEPIGLLKFILSDFGVPCQSKSKSDLVSALHTWLLQRHAAQDLPVVILDEAQALPLQTLDEIRLLLNLETPRGKLMQIVLSGQPELEERLRLPALRQLRQRIMVHSRLPVLSHKETAAYISSRLATAGCTGSSLFPEQVVQDIYESSRGIPRVVNLLCEQALISAYSEQQREISPEMIRRIAMDFDLLSDPLAVSDLEPQPHYTHLAPFPPVDEMEPPQSVAIQPPVKEDPVVVPTDSATEDLPKTVPQPVPPSAQRTYGYWRKHRSRWPVAVFARNSVASLRRSWLAFTDQCASVARAVRCAVFPPAEKNTRPPVASQRFTPGWLAQIDFGIFKDPVAAVHKGSQAAAEEHPLPAVPPPAPVQSPRYWRRHRSRPNVAAFARNAAVSVQRAWHALTHPFVFYVRSVSQSFVRDCRVFFRSLAPPMPALEFGSSTEGADEKSPALRNVLAPLLNWLRQPISPGPFSRNRSSASSGHRRQ